MTRRTTLTTSGKVERGDGEGRDVRVGIIGRTCVSVVGVYTSAGCVLQPDLNQIYVDFVCVCACVEDGSSLQMQVDGSVSVCVCVLRRERMFQIGIPVFLFFQ